ncbi:Hsp20/alpha crystallin family protein [Nocardioides sp.]|uniref:Hsp20/alpha crystallin family protein n=1 Tax=Nocardioides sp. TaxID=35761 RepID=UPI002625C841|nr:Hsp20/alpha crystallin family protein [Nocardioides sp.]MDI6910047.1 Hsp20/alpha crystallin family protein [Nocardioides sp.]
MASLVHDRFVVVEQFQRDGAYVVRVELPEVEVSVAGRYLVLRGVSARGTFSRSLRLPDGAEPFGLRTLKHDGSVEVIVPLVTGR